jgi:hypothetical protein
MDRGDGLGLGDTGETGQPVLVRQFGHPVPADGVRLNEVKDAAAIGHPGRFGDPRLTVAEAFLDPDLVLGSDELSHLASCTNP